MLVFFYNIKIYTVDFIYLLINVPNKSVTLVSIQNIWGGGGERRPCGQSVNNLRNDAFTLSLIARLFFKSWSPHRDVFWAVLYSYPEAFTTWPLTQIQIVFTYACKHRHMYSCETFVKMNRILLILVIVIGEFTYMWSSVVFVEVSLCQVFKVNVFTITVKWENVHKEL